MTAIRWSFNLRQIVKRVRGFVIFIPVQMRSAYAAERAGKPTLEVFDGQCIPQSSFYTAEFAVYLALVLTRQSMRKAKAVALARSAIAFTEEKNPGLLRWARAVGPQTFTNMRMRRLLEVYCRVVYASGFKYKTIKARFPAIARAFHTFDSIRISRMTSADPVLKAFGSRRKAESFLNGAKSIQKEGLHHFKRRVRADPLRELEMLPGIGPITCHHFAKDIGVLDTAKPDIWLERAAEVCEASSVSEMVSYQSAALGESQHTIDVAIWTFAEAGNLGVRANPSIERTCPGKPGHASHLKRWVALK